MLSILFPAYFFSQPPVASIYCVGFTLEESPTEFELSKLWKIEILFDAKHSSDIGI